MPNTVNSYMVTDLGNVSPNPRGEYNATYDYEYLDLVYYKGGSYVCLAPLGETIANVAPIAGQTTTNWQCVAIPGDLTPEYISMYNEVVKDYNETNTNTADVAQMKDSAYASMTAAQKSENKAGASEVNARASEVSAKQSMDKAQEYADDAMRSNNDTQELVSGFDERVATAISNAETIISESTENAKDEIIAQKSSSLNEFRTDAETVMTNEKNVAVAEIHNIVDDFDIATDAKEQEVIALADEKIDVMTALNDDTINAKNAAETASTTAFEKANEATTSADEAKSSENAVAEMKISIEQSQSDVQIKQIRVSSDAQQVSSDKSDILIMKSSIEDTAEKVDIDVQNGLQQILDSKDDSLSDIQNKKNEVIADIEQYGALQVSNEEPTSENVDLWINPDNEEEYSVPEIKDGEVNASDTWSSEKIFGEISELKSDLDNKCQSIIYSCGVDKNYVHENSVGSGLLTSAARFLVREPIEDKVIESVIVKSAGLVSGTLTVEVWELRDDTIYLLKAVNKPIDGDGKEYVVPINAVSEYPLYVSYAIDKNGVILYNADSVYKLSAIKDKESTSIQNALIQGGVNAEIVGKIITIDKMKYIKKPNNVIVIGDGQDFTEIQDALDVVADTEENPYTFLIMPRSQPYGRFSMLRKLDGTYPWTDAKTRYISLIGLDKVHCIIESDTGEYTEPAAEMLTNGIIKDLTFVTTKLNPWETPSKPGYAVHIDAQTLDDVGYNMTFEDCDFSSDVAPAVGVGLHPNCDLTFRRCNFISTATEDYQPTESYKNLSGYGCFFAHSSQLADAKNQCLTLVDCVGTCKEGNKSLRVNHAGNYSQETAEFTLTLIRNVFWNEKQGAPSYVIDSDLTMNPINYGNNN